LAATELDKEKQKAIWAAEHTTFEIEFRLGVAIRKALAAGDRDAVKRFLREDLKTRVLTSDFAERAKGPLHEESRAEGEQETGLAESGPDLLVEALFTPLARFQAVERSRFRVLQIVAGELPGRWTIKALLTLVGRGATGQPEFFESTHRIKLVIENEEKMLEERLIDSWVVLTETRRLSSQTLMEEVTESVGLDNVRVPDNWNLGVEQTEQYRFQLAVADFNLDGFPDIAVAVHQGRPILLESNAGKSFSDITEVAGIVGHGRTRNYAATWIDYDNDGYPDLILGDQLFHNQGGKTFEDVTQASGLFFQDECMGCSVVDFDCDGKLDLYLLYQHEAADDPTHSPQWVDENETGKANVLWRNTGNGRFARVPESNAGGGARHSHAAAWFFYDDDHLPDVYVANDFGCNVVLRNQGKGRFEDVSEASAAADFATSMGVAAGDLNNDGRSEVYVANMYSKMGRRIIGQVGEDDYPEGIFAQIEGSCAGNRLYSRAGTGSSFREISEHAGVNEVGWAFGAAMADWDNDGFLDLYATSGFMSFDRKKPDG
jgi:hypothetical protein